MPFNSTSGRAALSARGGQAYARLYRDAGYPNLVKALSARKAQAKRLGLYIRWSRLNSYCESNYGLTLLELLTTPEGAAILLHPPDSPRSKTGK